MEENGAQEKMPVKNTKALVTLIPKLKEAMEEINKELQNEIPDKIKIVTWDKKIKKLLGQGEKRLQYLKNPKGKPVDGEKEAEDWDVLKSDAEKIMQLETVKNALLGELEKNAENPKKPGSIRTRISGTGISALSSVSSAINKPAGLIQKKLEIAEKKLKTD